MSGKRRVYFDIEIGSVIAEVSYNGSVKIPSIDHDIQTYKSLSERNRETFDVIELDFGQYAQDFKECNGYQVNSETKELEFSYPDPNEPEAPQVFQKPLTEQMKELESKTDQAVMELTMIIAAGGM